MCKSLPETSIYLFFTAVIGVGLIWLQQNDKNKIKITAVNCVGRPYLV
jgi:hypothetical protein